LQGRLTAGVVGNIVSLQAQEIAQAAERYAELQAELEVSIFRALYDLCVLDSFRLRELPTQQVHRVCGN
jgi:hypothetical protein